MKARRAPVLIQALCTLLALSACAGSATSIHRNDVSALTEQVWAFSQSHPEGFTLDIRTFTEPTSGIAVSYAATQGSHTRRQLRHVVSHALQHDGYVGGWKGSADGRYYFDSTRLFPEDSLAAALLFGKANGQQAVYILSTHSDIPIP